MRQRLLLRLLVGAVALSGACRKDERDMPEYRTERFRDAASADELLYRLYSPTSKDPTTKLPLVLYLHGGGGRGTDNVAQLELGPRRLAQAAFQSRHAAFILVPQCPPKRQWLNHGFTTTPFPSYDQRTIPESAEIKLIVRLIAALVAKEPIDPARLYVTGFSMGGSGTWDIVARYPELFAAAAPLSGVSDPSQGLKLAALPIWAFHGGKDEISAAANTRAMVAAILGQGGEQIRHTEYAELGHDITAETYAREDLFDWMFAQKRAATSPLSPR